MADVERLRRSSTATTSGPVTAPRADRRRTAPRSPSVLEATNGLLERLEPLEAYLYALVTTDARDDEAAGALAGVEVGPRGVLDAADPARRMGRPPRRRRPLAAGDDVPPTTPTCCAGPGSPPTTRWPRTEEELLADLRLSGSTAWSRLAGDLSSTLAGDPRRGRRFP